MNFLRTLNRLLQPRPRGSSLFRAALAFFAGLAMVLGVLVTLASPPQSALALNGERTNPNHCYFTVKAAYKCRLLSANMWITKGEKINLDLLSNVTSHKGFSGFAGASEVNILGATSPTGVEPSSDTAMGQVPAGLSLNVGANHSYKLSLTGSVANSVKPGTYYIKYLGHWLARLPDGDTDYTQNWSYLIVHVSGPPLVGDVRINLERGRSLSLPLPSLDAPNQIPSADRVWSPILTANAPGNGLPAGLRVSNGIVTGSAPATVGLGIYSDNYTLTNRQAKYSNSGTIQIKLWKSLTPTPVSTRLSPGQSLALSPAYVGGPLDSWSVEASQGATPGAGVIPSGLSIDSAGRLLGRIDPSAGQGLYSFSARGAILSLSNSASVLDSANFSYTLAVVHPLLIPNRALTVTPGQELTQGPGQSLEEITAYAVSSTAAVTPGMGLPLGLSLNPSSGVITGTVDSKVSSGIYSFDLMAVAPYYDLNARPIKTTLTASWEISVITPASLEAKTRDLTLGSPVSINPAPSDQFDWSYAVANTGATTPGGGLPAGLSINATSGSITGLIASGVALGTYTPTVMLSATALGNSSATAVYTLLVRAKLSLGARIGSGGGQFLSLTPSVSGGPISGYSLLGSPATVPSGTGAYPSGLVLDTNSGVLSGSPAPGVSQGAYTFGLEVFGHSAESPNLTYSATALYTVSVISSPSINAQAKDLIPVFLYSIEPSPRSEFGWSYTASDVGAKTPESGLPSGLSINPSNGIIEGVIQDPVAVGTYTPTITVRAGGMSAIAVYTLLVREPLDISNRLISLAPGATLKLSPEKIGGPISGYSLLGSPATVPSGTGAYPSGLVLDTNSGVLSGSPAPGVSQGAYTFGLEVFGHSAESPNLTYSATALYTVLLVANNLGLRLGSRSLGASPGQADISLSPDVRGWPTAYALEGGSAISTPGLGLPSGLSINTISGVLSGNVVAGVTPGVYSFGLLATAPNVGSDGAIHEIVASATYTIKVIASPGLAAASARVSNYDLNPSDIPLTISPTPAGSHFGWTYAVSASDLTTEGAGLPLGLSIDPSSGIISGTVSSTQALGLYSPVITLSAPDISQTVTTTYRILVEQNMLLWEMWGQAVPGGPAVYITPNLIGGPVASYSLVGSGAASPVKGAYPLGFTIDPVSGVVGGSVSDSVAQGIYTFRVEVYPKVVGKTAYPLDASYTVLVAPPLSLSPANLTLPLLATLNQTASYAGFATSFTASPASPIIAPGSGIPKGLDIDSASGRLSGRLASDVSTGVYSFSLSALAWSIGANGYPSSASAAAEYRISIVSSPSISDQARDLLLSSSMDPIEPSPQSRFAWSYAASGAGATAPGRALPLGLAIDSLSGSIVGSPDGNVGLGIYTPIITVRAGDLSATANYTLLVRQNLGLASRVIGVYPSGTLTVNPTVTGGPVASYSLLGSPATTPANGAYPLGVAINSLSGQLSGSLSEKLTPGLYTFGVEVFGKSVKESTSAYSATASYTINVVESPSISDQARDLARLSRLDYISPNPKSQTGWNYTLSNTGATAPGSGLPAGLTLDANSGVISGTPEASVSLGVYTPTLTVSATGFREATAAYTLLVFQNLKLGHKALSLSPESTVKISPSTLGGPVVSYFINAPSATRPIEYSGFGYGGAWPSGLRLDSSSGVISGVLSSDIAQGAYVFPVLVYISSVENPKLVHLAGAVYTLLVASNPLLLPTEVMTSTGASLSLAPRTSGVLASFSLLGAAPPGLSLDPNSGLVSGQLSTLARASSYVFTLAAQAKTLSSSSGLFSSSPISALYTVKVIRLASVSNQSHTFFAGQLGISLAPSPKADSGWTYSLVGSALPPGLTLNGDSGAITGALPAKISASTYLVTVAVKAGVGDWLPKSKATYTLGVVPHLRYDYPDPYSITAAAGLPFTFTPKLEGSATSFRLDSKTSASNFGGQLPSGLSLDTVSGVISGTLPGDVTRGLYTLTQTARAEQAGNAASQTLVLVVKNPPTFTPALYTVTQGVELSLPNLSVSGGSGAPYTYALPKDINTGALVPGLGLPLGLSVNTVSGVISGRLATSVAPGLYVISFKVRDKDYTQTPGGPAFGQADVVYILKVEPRKTLPTAANHTPELSKVI